MNYVLGKGNLDKQVELPLSEEVQRKYKLSIRGEAMNFDIPTKMQTYLKELDQFIEQEIKPL